MISDKSSNKTFFQTVSFFRGLFSEGLEHVVISPGSRSTPLVLAAASLPRLQKHVVLDERSAAFLALGIGKATNKPAALVCTSGTAVANYFPAVIEARKSGVPMLLLTADRPARLHGTGANQTINQKHIFGDYPVLFKNIDEVLSPKKGLENIQNTALTAFCTSINKHGPVHLNFPFEKPLEPAKDFFKHVIDKNKASALPKKESKRANEQELQFNERQKKIIQSAERPLIIVGQLMPSSGLKTIFALGKQLNAPILSENEFENKALTIQGFDGFLRNEKNQQALKPDLIFRFGLQPPSKSVLQAVKKWKTAHHLYFTEDRRNYNINDTVTNFIEWNSKPIASKSLTPNNKKWLEKWKKAAYQFSMFKNRLLSKQDTLTDGHIYHHLSPAIPEDWFVFIANSFPARDHSLFGQWKTQQKFTNRGASGIDGITSTAIGVNAGLQKPGILFTGDLSFLHDTNALLNKDKLKHPLIIVVINNQGGSLFRMLPVAEYSRQFTPYFETPQEADITKLAASYGVDVTAIDTINKLNDLDLYQLIKHSSSMLQVIECQTNPDTSMKLRNKLWNFEL